MREQGAGDRDQGLEIRDQGLVGIRIDFEEK